MKTKEILIILSFMSAMMLGFKYVSWINSRDIPLIEACERDSQCMTAVFGHN